MRPDAWRAAYSKTLRFVGAESASRQLLAGDRVDSLRSMYDEKSADDRQMDIRRKRRAGIARERFGADLILDAGRYAVGIDEQVRNILVEAGIRQDITSAP